MLFRQLFLNLQTLHDHYTADKYYHILITTIEHLVSPVISLLLYRSYCIILIMSIIIIYLETFKSNNY